MGRRLAEIINIPRYRIDRETGKRIRQLSNIEYAQQQKYFLNQLSPDVQSAYRQLRAMWRDSTRRREFLKTHPGFKSLPSAKFLFEQVPLSDQLEKLQSYQKQFSGFASKANVALLIERLSGLQMELGMSIPNIDDVITMLMDNMDNIPDELAQLAYDILIDSNNPNYYKNYPIDERIEKILDLVNKLSTDLTEVFDYIGG